MAKREVTGRLEVTVEKAQGKNLLDLLGERFGDHLVQPLVQPFGWNAEEIRQAAKTTVYDLRRLLP